MDVKKYLTVDQVEKYVIHHDVALNRDSLSEVEDHVLYELHLYLS